MYYVYLLKSKHDRGFYIGQTRNLEARFLEHQNGMVESTRSRLPVRLVYQEGYEDPKKALERERKLKDFGSAYVGLLKRLGYKQQCS